MRVALSSMASNTGLSSPGELEDNLEHLRGCRLLLLRLSKMLPCLGEFLGPIVELFSQVGCRGTTTARSR